GTDNEDQESLYGALYYRRRSPKVDADVFFPLFWNVRDGENRVSVVGPWMHREAPQEHDNWLAPLYFQGSRKDGGYFHAPLLLTTSSWDKDAAFTIAGPYFRVRKKDNVDGGIFPLYFHGESGSIGTHKSYTLIPPLLTYVRTDELENTRFAVHGPVILSSSPKRESLSVFPLYFQIRGKPETGGIRESHTTLFPLFHYGETDTESLFATPLYLRRKTPTVDTLLTPLFSHATARKGRTSLYAAGPIIPIFFHYTDEDTTERTTALAPFFYSHSSPERSDFMTPLFGTFDHKGVSRTTWIFPTFTSTATNRGYLNAFHPIFYNSKSDADSFTMAALLYWDFNSPKARSTVAFPLFWRFADKDLGSVTQVAGNTLYLERKVEGGSDWEFHFLPIFSYGKKPNGHFWNILFGLTGYQSEGSYSRIKLLWIPIQTGGPSASAK
nr:hypothetical protein [Polyangiaceae bacterium]